MRFNGERLRVLRQFHHHTQRELAELVGSAASAINAYERGSREPKGLVLDALCAVLNVGPELFVDAKQDDEFHEHETNFRSLVSTPDRLRKKVLAHATLFGAVLDLLATKVKRPALKLPQVQATTPEELERAAEQCRMTLGVGVDAPIHDVTHMIEHAGVVVTSLDREIGKQVDAFSRYGATNLIVRNPAKGSATRLRFDMAHEAAHGALHRRGTPVELATREDQANYFANAMLLPQRAFSREFWQIGRSRTWEHLLDLKQRWGASLPAIVMRSYHLGLIDAAEYRRRYKHMSQAGWLRGSGEPGEPTPETPQLFSLMLRRYQVETRKSTSAIADDLHWTPALFQEITGVEATADPPVVDIAPITAPPPGTAVTSFEEYRRRKMASG